AAVAAAAGARRRVSGGDGDAGAEGDAAPSPRNSAACAARAPRRHWPAGWSVAVLLLAAGGLRAEITIEGRVALPQTHRAPVMNKRYEVVTKGGVIAINPPLAVVYLEGKFPPPAGPATVVLPQKDLAFVPSLMAVRVGTRVEFPNEDDVYHNIFSYSSPKRFDLGRYRKDERPVPSIVFDKPGLETLRCDIHEHMRGLLLIVDTPYFVVTDAEGNYRLTGLPEGHYELKAWLSSQTTLVQAVDLTAGAHVHADFP
ncbi:MAG TPA: carboxypeptidase regulatory-like domain-containing protein, partial [Opitutus sp.]|nr:carboxypeptidase regulatory-like domain-containing protein [Opitutus sp.]